MRKVYVLLWGNLGTFLFQAIGSNIAEKHTDTKSAGEEVMRYRISAVTGCSIAYRV